MSFGAPGFSLRKLWEARASRFPSRIENTGVGEGQDQDLTLNFATRNFVRTTGQFLPVSV